MNLVKFSLRFLSNSLLSNKLLLFTLCWENFKQSFKNFQKDDRIQHPSFLEGEKWKFNELWRYFQRYYMGPIGPQKAIETNTFTLSQCVSNQHLLGM